MVHIYVNSLIRNHFEWLRFRADVTLRHASLAHRGCNRQVGARRGIFRFRPPLTSDFLLTILAQNDQWIFAIISALNLVGVSLGKLNLFSERILKCPFKETERGVIRC